MHDAASVCIPVTVIILAASWNRSDMKAAKQELDARMSQVEARINEGFMRIENRLLTIEGDIRRFSS